MTEDQTPLAPQEMVSYAEEIAQTMFEEMAEEDAVLMVKDFVSLIASWQPDAYDSIREDPVALAVTTLTTAKLFQLAFVKAYKYGEKHVQATEAIENALKGVL